MYSRQHFADFLARILSLSSCLRQSFACFAAEFTTLGSGLVDKVAKLAAQILELPLRLTQAVFGSILYIRACLFARFRGRQEAGHKPSCCSKRRYNRYVFKHSLCYSSSYFRAFSTAFIILRTTLKSASGPLAFRSSDAASPAVSTTSSARSTIRRSAWTNLAISTITTTRTTRKM